MRYYWMGHVKLSGVIEAASFEAAIAMAQAMLDATPLDRWPTELETVIPASEVSIGVIPTGTQALPS